MATTETSPTPEVWIRATHQLLEFEYQPGIVYWGCACQAWGTNVPVPRELAEEGHARHLAIVGAK